MGNYKFKISDMLPNAWFLKLQNMTKPKTTKPSSSSSSNTCQKKKPFLNSHLHSESLVANNPPHYNSPRNSLHTKRMSKRKTLYKPSTSCSHPLASPSFNKTKINLFPALESSHESIVYSFYKEEDIEFKINTRNIKHNVKSCHASNIVDKPRTSNLSVKINKDIDKEDKAEKKYSSGRKSSIGINLKRVNSPRIQLSSTSRRSMSSKQSVLESFAVKKCSIDPKKDFKESMVEMIEENKISASKDLEDLLACYLSLNPKEYHDLIIEVFEKIWRQLTKTK